MTTDFPMFTTSLPIWWRVYCCGEADWLPGDGTAGVVGPLVGFTASSLFHMVIPPPRRATQSATQRSKIPERGRRGQSPQSISAARNCCLGVLLLGLSGDGTIKDGNCPMQRIYFDHNAPTPVLP